MSDKHDILIAEDGTVRFVYADELLPLFEGEPQTTMRASHVEPHPTRPGWVADMRPSGGPILGGHGSWTKVDTETSLPSLAEWFARCGLAPFETRQAALEAERQWLREHKGL